MLLAGRLDIQGDCRRKGDRLFNRSIGCARNYFKVDVSPVLMHSSQKTGNSIYPVHCVIRIAEDSRTEEKSEDLFFSHVFHKYGGDLFRRKSAASDVRVRAERAVPTVVRTGVRKQSLQEYRIST